MKGKVMTRQEPRFATAGNAAPSSRLEVELAHRDWALFVCSPIDTVDGRRTARVGDVDRYATRGGSDPAEPMVWSDPVTTTG